MLWIIESAWLGRMVGFPPPVSQSWYRTAPLLYQGNEMDILTRFVNWLYKVFRMPPNHWDLWVDYDMNSFDYRMRLKSAGIYHCALASRGSIVPKRTSDMDTLLS